MDVYKTKDRVCTTQNKLVGVRCVVPKDTYINLFLSVSFMFIP